MPCHCLLRMLTGDHISITSKSAPTIKVWQWASSKAACYACMLSALYKTEESAEQPNIRSMHHMLKHTTNASHGGIRSKGAVSAMQRSKALSTAALAVARQCGFMATDSSARRRTQLWCPPRNCQWPRMTSSL